jgi:exodeoxyribonuclease III
MSTLKLVSWNVNGIRAIHRKGNFKEVMDINPDILCVQETKAQEEQAPADIREMPGYQSYFVSAEKRGYSGVALFSRREPISISRGFGIEAFDSEGRTLAVDFGDFILYNVYFPNGKASEARLEYKMAFYDAFLEHMDKLHADGRHVVICGDVNTAHREIDLSRPKENSKVSGFLPSERAWIDKLIEHGFVDTFRMFNEQPGQYSWWHYISKARERNVGWRIDYFFVSEGFKERVVAANIHSDIMGSDHCPVSIDITL